MKFRENQITFQIRVVSSLSVPDFKVFFALF